MLIIIINCKFKGGVGGFMKIFEFFHKNKETIDINNIPRHIAIIMDGNGRWAKRRGLPRSAGHSAGAENLINIIEECANIGVKYLTVYAFSTENWNRSQKEVDYLMDLFLEYCNKFDNDERSKHVKLKVLGNINKLSQKLQQEIISTEEKTKNNSKLQLNIAINYGGRDEIHNAIKNILNDYKDKDIDSLNIDEKFFVKYLYTKDIPDPDLIIRPSGEMRISNFLLYQCAYSEFWFARVNWPDFDKKCLHKAICDFQNRDRRFGGI